MDVMDKIMYGTLSAIFKHHKDRIQDDSNQDRIKWKKAQSTFCSPHVFHYFFLSFNSSCEYNLCTAIFKFHTHVSMMLDLNICCANL